MSIQQGIQFEYLLLLHRIVRFDEQLNGYQPVT